MTAARTSLWKTEQILTGGTGSCGADGAGARVGVSLAVGREGSDDIEDRLKAGNFAEMRYDMP